MRQGHVSVVNVFGSWCEPCRFEHPILLALASDEALKEKGVVVYGVAQKDSSENVRRFLGALGDPYAKVGLDPDDRAGIDWGVYGVPETFVVRGDGTIAYKVVGPMTADAYESEVKPQILKAAGADAAQEPNLASEVSSVGPRAGKMRLDRQGRNAPAVEEERASLSIGWRLFPPFR